MWPLHRTPRIKPDPRRESRIRPRKRGRVRLKRRADAPVFRPDRFRPEAASHSPGQIRRPGGSRKSRRAPIQFPLVFQGLQNLLNAPLEHWDVTNMAAILGHSEAPQPTITAPGRRDHSRIAKSSCGRRRRRNLRPPYWWRTRGRDAPFRSARQITPSKGREIAPRTASPKTGPPGRRYCGPRIFPAAWRGVAPPSGRTAPVRDRFPLRSCPGWSASPPRAHAG